MLGFIGGFAIFYLIIMAIVMMCIVPEVQSKSDLNEALAFASLWLFWLVAGF